MARYDATTTVMMRAIEQAAKSLLRDFGEVENLQISMKGTQDFVSAADKRAEKILYEELLKARPDFGFLMEESGEVKGKDDTKRWIIDPLDGTKNFLNGIPHWNISVALEDNGEITHGVVADPVKNETFWAERNNGAFSRHQRLRVSNKKDMSRSLLGFGSIKHKNPYTADTQREQNIVHTQLLADTRRMGAAALDLAYVAAGRLDGYWEYNLKPWDCAAGVLLVREAGGFVSSMDQKANPIYSGSLICGNQYVHDQLLKTLKKAKAA